MIIGMPKCGTTDMMASIMNHPDVVPPIDKDGTILKEIHFFDGCHYGKECMYNYIMHSVCTIRHTLARKYPENNLGFPFSSDLLNITFILTTLDFAVYKY
jgi:hypothetical protein